MTALATKRRLEYIDAAKAVGILMIMLGHITDINSNPVDVWMSSLKITIFYVISGFLMAHTGGLHKRTPSQFTGNLLRTIMWPYCTFSVIAILAKCYYNFSNNKDISSVIEVFKENLCKTVFLRGINSMWFIPTLFFGELIILLLFHAPKIFRYLYAAAGLFGIRLGAFLIDKVSAAELGGLAQNAICYLINTLSKSIVAAWFVGFGYVFYLFMRKYGLLEGKASIKLAIGLILSVVNLVLSLRNPHVDFNMLTMGDVPLLFVFGGTAGTIGLILLLDAVTSRFSTASLNYWGKNSLVIMCTHTALGFKGIVVNGWKKVANIPDHLCKEYYIQTIMALIILMLLMCGVIELINRHFPYLKDLKKKQEAI